jgi:hypothetical protein
MPQHQAKTQVATTNGTGQADLVSPSQKPLADTYNDQAACVTTRMLSAGATADIVYFNYNQVISFGRSLTLEQATSALDRASRQLKPEDYGLAAVAPDVWLRGKNLVGQSPSGPMYDDIIVGRWTAVPDPQPSSDGKERYIALQLHMGKKAAPEMGCNIGALYDAMKNQLPQAVERELQLEKERGPGTSSIL